VPWLFDLGRDLAPATNGLLGDRGEIAGRTL
jgi:hypothetical protein